MLDNLLTGAMTGADRKRLKTEIQTAQPTPHQLAWLRSRIFDMAKEHLGAFQPETVIMWLEEANKLLLPEANCSEPYDLVTFSPGVDGKNLIKSQLSSAVKTLDVCVFTISDNDISNVVIFAHRRGVKVRIITDDMKQYDEGSDIEILRDAGIEIRMDSSEQHMHHKFAIIDGERLLTGSYNWTRTAADRNYENLMVTNDEGLVKPFANEFERLWAMWGA